MKKILYTAILGCGLVLSGAAYADNASASSGVIVQADGKERLQYALQQLNLTDAQKKEVHTFMFNIEPKFAQNIIDSNANKEALDALADKPYDATEVAKLADTQGKLVADKIRLRMAVRHGIYEILTPAQRKQLEEMQKMA